MGIAASLACKCDRCSGESQYRNEGERPNGLLHEETPEERSSARFHRLVHLLAICPSFVLITSFPVRTGAPLTRGRLNAGTQNRRIAELYVALFMILYSFEISISAEYSRGLWIMNPRSASGCITDVKPTSRDRIAVVLAEVDRRTSERARLYLLCNHRLSITHKLSTKDEAELDISETGQPSPHDDVARSKIPCAD